ncbi:MAG TPA: VOC family protein [Ramlibacter sp.]|jgi:catechol 2,3-dioxygenase-like lactoylglutathione lyase family enzyme
MPASLGLDHVYLRVADLDVQLGLFHEVLGLPLSWPVRAEPFARYAWVNAGNVQLELWQAQSDDDLPRGTTLPCIAGLALWPQDVHESRDSLARAGIACKEPRTWSTAAGDGHLAANFTNCLVTGASSPACQVFFCQWDSHAPITPWPRGESAADRRERLAAALAEAGGGTVGLTGLRAIHMESPDPADTARVWMALTGEPDAAAPGVALQLSNAAQTRIVALVFGVRHLPHAETSLRSRGLETAREEGVLWIDPAAASGLRIGFVGA